MRKILTIRTPGLTIEIPGSRVCKTPAKIDVTHVDPKLLEIRLRQYGIVDYTIKKEDLQIIQKSDTVKIEAIDLIQPMQIEELNSRFDKLEELIKNSLKGKQQNVVYKNLDAIMEELEEEKDEFIPTISTDQLTMNKDVGVESKSENVRTLAEKLREISARNRNG